MVGEKGHKMSKILIGIHGKPRAGKDTVAKRLVSKYKLLQYGPSFPVKKATAAMFEIDEQLLWDDKTKDLMDEYWGISYREMAQKVGKESSRDVFGDDFWMRHVDLMWTRIQNELPYNNYEDLSYGGMLLADIRYANEVAWVKRNGGLVIFVTRENRDYVANESHPAEQGLDLSLADVVIPNNGTIEELHAKVNMCVAPFLSK